MYDLSEYERVKPENLSRLPFIAIIGGVPSVGKSTVAIELAHRLGVDRVAHTDIITEVMHAYENPQITPLLFEHTYESWRHFGEKTPENMLKGYLSRARLMHPMIRRIVNRSVNKGRSLVMEGVHVTSELAEEVRSLATVFILTVKEDQEHLSRIESKNTGRTVPNSRLHEYFDVLRFCNRGLVASASAHGAIVIENGSLERTVAKMIEEKKKWEAAQQPSLRI